MRERVAKDEGEVEKKLEVGEGGKWVPVDGSDGSAWEEGVLSPATYVLVNSPPFLSASELPKHHHNYFSLSDEVSQESWSSGQHR